MTPSRRANSTTRKLDLYIEHERRIFFLLLLLLFVCLVYSPTKRVMLPGFGTRLYVGAIQIRDRKKGITRM